jgi:hypothetical protein
MRPVDKLTDDDRAELRRLCGLCPDLAAIRDLARGFAELVRTRGGQRLTAWVEQAEQATITEIRSFANGLRKDWDAVKAGLTMTWSSGAVEGNVNRIILWNQSLPMCDASVAGWANLAELECRGLRGRELVRADPKPALARAR